ncbi:MAG: molybdopterin-dependent oxidoreductase [Nitrospirota bacterium]|nr:molybdopterin-dependent oxidoreductase [Nitrospirota bacterium]
MADQQVKLTIDGKEVEVPAGTSILEAAKTVGIAIPHFCYHPKLSIVASCRLCLVEIEKAPKLVTSCSTPVMPDVKVLTNTPKVIEAREDMLAMFLTSHPLDCPVCDKGGECPLQNYTFAHGPGRSFFTDEKWHFEKPVDIGEHILIDRERCVMCTRCVRFQEEIAQHPELGIFDRNKGSYIGPHPDRRFDSNYSGNTTELCPVGALTTKEFRFKARPWEYTRKPSVCPSCGCGCNVSLDIRQGQVMRVVARKNPDIDDGWLCDRGRFNHVDLYGAKRTTVPSTRTNGKMTQAGWDEALDFAVRNLKTIKERFGSGAIAGIISPSLTCEEMHLFTRLFREVIGSDLVAYGLDEILPASPPFRIKDIDSADLIVLDGCDPERDLPILDLRIKVAMRFFGAKVVQGNDQAAIAGAQRPLKIGKRNPAGNATGAAAIIKDNRGAELATLLREGKIKALYLVGGEPGDALMDEIAPLLQGRDDLFVIAQGAVLPPNVAEQASVLLPAAAYPEKEGTLVNLEGRMQRIAPVASLPGQSLPGTEIFRRVAKGFDVELRPISVETMFDHSLLNNPPL